MSWQEHPGLLLAEAVMDGVEDDAVGVAGAAGRAPGGRGLPQRGCGCKGWPGRAEAGIAVDAGAEAEPAGGLGDRPAVTAGALVSGRVHPGRQCPLLPPDPRGHLAGDACPDGDRDAGHDAPASFRLSLCCWPLSQMPWPIP